MQLWIPFAAAAGTLLGIASFVGADWDAPPVETTQMGYRGTGMNVIKDVDKVEALKALNAVPEPLWEADPEGDRASEIYENVQVLGDLSDDQFNLFMAAITEWVAPEEGCGYCHNLENLASDEVYTKVVSRRMIQMNQTINVDWEPHVGDVGVTCYTCHRGQAVPAYYWYDDQEPKPASASGRGRQNVVGQFVGNTSMPQNALAEYLLGDKDIRVHSLTALPDPANPNPAGTKETESTWALMMHMSEGLGVNCVTCHNSRAFNDWDQSPPQRVTAWHGIQMTRALNNDYMVGLTPVFPDNRKGPEGDVFKIGCSTCHQGVQKPLYGVSMLQNYVDALDKKGPTAVPDYSKYVPGETQTMAPDGPTNSSALPAKTTVAATQQ
ncbi:photosynthetic reaction center cytochrome PufC [Roseibium alexandrii]|uniref:Photosynthetic reaction center cytochrome c subunit n=1 Tax=Roseibium alexandrii TaxID=388408 RepID=A0A0M7AAI9_9HYPH|nr:photosynthetic reaction center cytochrome PufC [Roseibium alexandrii]CTQ71879.1 Cytochrome c558/c559 [Roseibium alexandrii]